MSYSVHDVTEHGDTASDKLAQIRIHYRQSSNGTTWGAAPYVYWSAHNAAYGYYDQRLNVCTGC